MNTRLGRTLYSMAAVIFGAAPGCGGRTEGLRIDSESHFLGECDATCAPGLSCVCGACTRPCAESLECGTTSAQAVCRTFEAAECGGQTTSVCDVACAADGDCAGLTAPARCSNGWCRIDSVALTLSSATLRTCPAPGLGLLVEDQATLNALEGCEIIAGDVNILFDADLRPLHALRRVAGYFTVLSGTGGGRMSSLEGLENLEQVDQTLSFSSLDVTSLRSLSRLRSIGPDANSAFRCYDCPNLRDLSGLEELSGLRALMLSGMPQLTTLSPLQPATWMDRVTLSGTPALIDIDALRSVTTIVNLELIETGLPNLDAFGGVTSMVNVLLGANALLVDTSMLAGLESLGELGLHENPRLETAVTPRALRALALGGNSSLRALSGLDELTSMDLLEVADNPLLPALSLPSLEEISLLNVSRNSGLTLLDVPRLGPLEQLIVVSNPRLPSPAALSSIARVSKIAGNMGEPRGLDPCPWPEDGRCDAPPVDALCAAGTDSEDCSRAPEVWR